MTPPPEETPGAAEPPPDPASPSGLPVSPAATTSPLAPSNVQRWQIVLAVVALIIYLLLALFLRGGASGNPQAAHAAAALDALRTAKFAYSEREQRPAGIVTKGSKTGQDAAHQLEEAAIAEWRKLAEDKNGTPGDWRRLGILRFAFGKPGGMEALQRAIALLEMLPTVSDHHVVVVVQPDEKVSPEAERALWNAIYGPAPLDKVQVPNFRARLAGLNLGWFEPVAAVSLYRKAGMSEEAAQAQADALAGTRASQLLMNLQLGLVLLGFLCLFRYLLARRSAVLPGMPPQAPRPQARITARFSPQALFVAFGVYLAAFFLVGLPLLPFRPALEQLPLGLRGRLNIALSLLLYLPVVYVTLLALRRLAQQEAPSDVRPSLATVAVWIGLRPYPLAQAVRTAVVGFAMCQPFLLAAAALSNRLFQHYPTPPNPVILWVAALQNPLDKIALLAEAALAAPIVEEMMFRGLLYPALRERVGVAGGIALSAAVFALVHPTLPGGFLPIWVLGAAFALAYERSGGSLLPSILMHGMNNGLLLLNAFAALAK